uniref:BTB domain-containing protein n=1 Tax=Panagrolaimus sp. ES5 TaxID=591445 RepID=A0AC34FXJ3_9BILA
MASRLRKTKEESEKEVESEKEIVQLSRRSKRTKNCNIPIKTTAATIPATTTAISIQAATATTPTETTAAETLPQATAAATPTTTTAISIQTTASATPIQTKVAETSPQAIAAAIPTTTPASSNASPSLQHSKLYQSLTDKKYHDVILVASGGSEITTHRCILAKYSSHFANIFEQTKELPIKISINDFDLKTIQAAVDFMFGKPDAINKKQFSLFKFAAEYNIPDLLKECCAFVVQRTCYLLSSGIWSYIKIAYQYNLEELKQKLLKIMIKKRKEIASKWDELPKKVIIDVLNC